MQKIFILALLLFPAILYSQQLSKYKGPAETLGIHSGDIVEYQYYENTEGERIFQGSFQINNSDMSITGQYLNDKKNGTWKETGIDCGFSVYSNILESIEYKDGKLNGVCTAQGVAVNDKKTMTLSVSATYRNNIPIGEFKYYITDGYGNGNTNATFNFDENGLFDGVCILQGSRNNKSDKFERKCVYKHGILQSKITRNLTNGEIIEKFNSSTNEFIQNNTDAIQYVFDKRTQYLDYFFECTLSKISRGDDTLLPKINSFTDNSCDIDVPVGSPKGVFSVPTGFHGLSVNKIKFVNAEDWDKSSNITIPSGVKIIDMNQFRSSDRLVSLRIASSVGEIGNRAFQNCKNLSQVFMEAEIPPAIGQSVFPDREGKIIIHVKNTIAVAAYTDAGWDKYGKIVTP